MYHLRTLNELGTRQFERYLDDVRSGQQLQVPVGILTDSETSEDISPSIEIEHRVFPSRFEMGQYLIERFKPLDQQSILQAVGLWNWLALFYFDQLCTPNDSGIREPRENYTYVLSPDYRHRPRHAVRTTYEFVRRFGPRVQFMFSKPLGERGEIVEQLVSRQELAACASVIEAADVLYGDRAGGTFKRGAAGRGRGSIQRFVRVLQQFQLTYDLASVSAPELVSLLPAEFDRFKSPGG